MPLLKLKMALRSLNIGDCVYLTATDPNSEHDIGAFCRHTGHSLVNIATPIVALTHLDKNTDTPPDHNQKLLNTSYKTARFEAYLMTRKLGK